MKKYEFTGEAKEFFGRTLHRIRAVIDFGDVKAGNLGGWIEKEENLSHEGKAWVSGQACISGEACVFDEACISGQACIFGQARIYGQACISGEACIYGRACIFDEACIYGEARISGQARISGEACIYGQYQHAVIGPMGSRNDFTTFFRSENLEICVTCGCFRGNINAFAEKVKETHGDNEHAKRYMAAIEFAKACIDLTPEAE